MSETSYIPDPKPSGFQSPGSRQLPVGFPYDSLVPDRRTVIRAALSISTITLLVPGAEKLVGVMIRNAGSAACIIGPDNTIGTTSSTGLPALGAVTGGGAPVFLRTNASIWVNSTGTSIDVIEIYRS